MLDDASGNPLGADRGAGQGPWGRGASGAAMILSSVEPGLERCAPGSAGVPPTRAGGPQEKTRRRPTIAHASGTPALPGTPPAVPHMPCRSEAKPRREAGALMQLRTITDAQDALVRRIAYAAAILDEGGDPRSELRRLIAELEARPDANLLADEIALVEDLHAQIDGALRADYGYRASPEWLAAVSDSLDARAPGSTATGGDVARLDENVLTLYRRLDLDPLNPPGPSTAGAAPGVRVAGAPSEHISESDTCEDAAGPRSDLYKKPVPFQGRSLEGVPAGGDRKELARSLDAEIPVEDLLPIEPCPDEPDRKTTVMSHPVIDVNDEDDALIERRTAYAKHIRTRPIRRRDSVRGGVGGRTEVQVSRGGQRPLGRICLGEPHRANLVQRGPAPDSDPRRARDHPMPGPGREYRRSVPRRRSPEHARPLPRRTLRPEPRGRSRTARPDSAGSRPSGTSSRSRAASGS